MNTQETTGFIRKFFAHPFPDDLKMRFGQWLTSDYQNEDKKDAMCILWEEESAEANEQTLDDLELLHVKIRDLRPRRFRMPAVWQVVAAVSLVLIGSFASYLFMKPTSANNDVNILQCFVPFGERKSVQLPDGSVAWLNAGSLLIYPDKFNASTRSLYLSGEAEFTVIKNKEKPFIVKTNHVDVEALGTVFSVTSYPGDTVTDAMLEEGSVRVCIHKQVQENRILFPNDLLTYSHNTGKITIRNINTSQRAKWKEGYLIFESATLAEIFRDIERRHNVSIYFEKHKIGTGIYNIKFMPNETAKQNLEVLKELIDGFDYKIKGNQIYIN
jgi:ferric-dicitrate binding protein FerR (iron transport regulator)